MNNCIIDDAQCASKTANKNKLFKNIVLKHSAIKNAKTMQKNAKIMQIIANIAIILIISIIISNPLKFIDSARQGVFLWGNNVLPALFPFMFLTKILVGILPKYKIRPSIYVFSISVLSGYPISSKLLRDYYDKGLITTEYAKRVYSYSATSGPIFVIGTVGAMFFNDIKVGIMIFVVHIITSLLTGLLLGGFKRSNVDTDIKSDTDVNYGKVISESIFSSISSILMVGAYIMVFYVLFDAITSIGLLDIVTRWLEKVNVHSDLSFGILAGMIELTRGVYELGGIGSKLAIAVSGGLISFSGFCILMQSYTFLQPVGVTFRYILLVKIIHALLTFIGLAILLLFGI